MASDLAAMLTNDESNKRRFTELFGG